MGELLNQNQHFLDKKKLSREPVETMALILTKFNIFPDTPYDYNTLVQHSDCILQGRGELD